jgi:hypothetical protein
MGVDHPRSLYLLVDHEPAEQCRVLRWIAGRLKVAAPRRVPPEAGKPARGTKRCRNALLLDSGYAFRYPTFREGYEALITPPSGEG